MVRTATLIFLAMALSAATRAHAQDTNCLKIGNLVNCHTDGPQASPSPQPDYSRLPNPGNGYVDAVRQNQEIELQRQQIELQRLQIDDLRRRQQSAEPITAADNTKAEHATTASKLVASGHCNEAIAYLKSVDDAAMLQSAIAVCLSTSPPKQ